MSEVKPTAAEMLKGVRVTKSETAPPTAAKGSVAMTMKASFQVRNWM